MSSTHTLAELQLTPAAYDEIKVKLRMAGYHHAFDGDTIDMTGIGVTEKKEAPAWVAPSPLQPRTRSA